MKKFYLFAMLGIAMSGSNQIYAQCLGTEHASSYSTPEVCAVYGSGLPPGAEVRILNLNDLVIAIGIAGTDGKIGLSYPCNEFADRLSIVIPGVYGNDCSVPVIAQAPLPVKLSSFNAELKADSKVALKWTSSMELTSFKYIVQKSNDGLNFSDIGDVPAAGNSFVPINYAFSDNNFVSGASYFRLKQVDIDGKYEYSKTVYVNNQKDAGVGLVSSITPNPFVSDVQLIGINSGELNAKNVQLFNSFGQRVNYRVSGANAIEIDPSAASGIYILRVKQQTFKLIKN